MHNLEINGWNINVNGDFSGDVVIDHPDELRRISIPFAILEGIVAEKVRRERIAAIEQMPPTDLLR